MPSYSERGRREGTACTDISLAALSAFPACLLSSSRHSWPSPPAIVPSVHPSSHQAIHPAFFPSSLSSQRPPFLQVSFPAVSHPGPSPRGLHPGAVRPPQSLRLLLRDSSFLESFSGSFQRLFPESLSGALFQTCLPPAVLQPACHPPALSSDIGNPCTRFFPMDVFIEVFKDILTGLFRNACSGSCAGTPVPPVLHPVALWHCCPIVC